jgi:diacylglycerol kinase (ATP)
VAGDVRRGGIAVFVNPLSRANRRNPRFAAAFQAAVGDMGRVLAPTSLAELDAMAARLRAAPPEVIAVHGGDGTLHKTVTALGRAFGDAPLPPIAVLAGGTMNVVASSLRILAPPAAFLRAIADDLRAGRPLELLPRRCLRVGEHLGFVFGNGLSANFLGEYYSPNGYGPLRAVWLLLRTVMSAVVKGPFVRRVFRRFEGRVTVDGATLPGARFVGVGAATVREVGLGFKLNHRADDDPERFGVLAIFAPPLALVRDFAAVHAGRGIAPSRAFSAVASSLQIEPSASSSNMTSLTPGPGPSSQAGSQAGEMSYTIDGDLYRTAGALHISVGPRITFVKPRLGPGAGKRLSHSVLPALRGPVPGDTMVAPR